jgi:predicted aldo/keto reductase-like oxidoreductase
MKKEFQNGTLGKTGLRVGRLGLAASYGAPAEAFEEAFEYGCNYFYSGSGRHRAEMKKAIRNICSRGQRDKIIVAIQTYARLGILTELLFRRTLRSLNLDYADILILGWHNKRPSEMLLERALKLKEKGLVRFLGMSGHNRNLFPQMAEKDIFDLFHIRYNAAHRGAEKESFPYMIGKNRPGIVSYTATRWGHLLNPKKMPPGESALKSSDCYRFVLSNPSVDVCMCGPKDISQMREALTALELGRLEIEDMERIKKIGEHVHSKSGSFF